MVEQELPNIPPVNAEPPAVRSKFLYCGHGKVVNLNHTGVECGGSYISREEDLSPTRELRKVPKFLGGSPVHGCHHPSLSLRNPSLQRAQEKLRHAFVQLGAHNPRCLNPRTNFDHHGPDGCEVSFLT